MDLSSASSFAFQSSKETRSSSSVGWGSVGGRGIRQHIGSCPSLGLLRAMVRNGSLGVICAARTECVKRRRMRGCGSEENFMAEINNSTRMRKNHQGGDLNARQGWSWSGINPIVCSYPFIGHLAKIRDEHLYFRAVYITIYGKADTATLGATHARITLRRKQ